MRIDGKKPLGRSFPRGFFALRRVKDAVSGVTGSYGGTAKSRMPVSEANRITAGRRRYQEASGLYQTFMLSSSPEIWVLRVRVPLKA